MYIMYSIIENDNITETLIDTTVDSIDEFIAFVKDTLQNENYVFSNNVPIETILNDNKFGYDKYVVHNENTITYLEKIKRDNSEFIYILNNSEIKIIYTWRLVNNIIKYNIDNFYTGERRCEYSQNKLTNLIMNDDF